MVLLPPQGQVSFPAADSGRQKLEFSPLVLLHTARHMVSRPARRTPANLQHNKRQEPGQRPNITPLEAGREGQDLPIVLAQRGSITRMKVVKRDIII